MQESHIKLYEAKALEAAAKSECKKRKVGAVAVNYTGDLDAVATGCNYNVFGEPCEDIHGNTCQDVRHAEVAALLSFKDKHPTLQPTHIFVTHPPCKDCLKVIARAGIPEANIHVVEQFMKFDSGKLRYGLIPPEATESLAKVLTYGAKKYKPNNWQHGEPTRYIDALYRHLEAWRSGEQNDSESGLPHLSHALTNIAFLIWFEQQE
mgnify:CR=1 FL=1